MLPPKCKTMKSSQNTRKSSQNTRNKHKLTPAFEYSSFSFNSVSPKSKSSKYRGDYKTFCTSLQSEETSKEKRRQSIPSFPQTDPFDLPVQKRGQSIEHKFSNIAEYMVRQHPHPYNIDMTTKSRSSSNSRQSTLGALGALGTQSTQSTQSSQRQPIQELIQGQIIINRMQEKQRDLSNKFAKFEKLKETLSVKQGKLEQIERELKNREKVLDLHLEHISDSRRAVGRGRDQRRMSVPENTHIQTHTQNHTLTHNNIENKENMGITNKSPLIPVEPNRKPHKSPVYIGGPEEDSIIADFLQDITTSTIFPTNKSPKKLTFTTPNQIFPNKIDPTPTPKALTNTKKQVLEGIPHKIQEKPGDLGIKSRNIESMKRIYSDKKSSLHNINNREIELAKKEKEFNVKKELFNIRVKKFNTDMENFNKTYNEILEQRIKLSKQELALGEQLSKNKSLEIELSKKLEDLKVRENKCSEREEYINIESKIQKEERVKYKILKENNLNLDNIYKESNNIPFGGSERKGIEERGRTSRTSRGISTRGISTTTRGLSTTISRTSRAITPLKCQFENIFSSVNKENPRSASDKPNSISKPRDEIPHIKKRPPQVPPLPDFGYNSKYNLNKKDNSGSTSQSRMSRIMELQSSLMQRITAKSLRKQMEHNTSLNEISVSETEENNSQKNKCNKSMVILVTSPKDEYNNRNIKEVRENIIINKSPKSPKSLISPKSPNKSIISNISRSEESMELGTVRIKIDLTDSEGESESESYIMGKGEGSSGGNLTPRVLRGGMNILQGDNPHLNYTSPKKLIRNPEMLISFGVKYEDINTFNNANANIINTNITSGEGGVKNALHRELNIHRVTKEPIIGLGGVHPTSLDKENMNMNTNTNTNMNTNMNMNMNA